MNLRLTSMHFASLHALGRGLFGGEFVQPGSWILCDGTSIVRSLIGKFEKVQLGRDGRIE
jgi:hypothetical protein